MPLIGLIQSIPPPAAVAIAASGLKRARPVLQDNTVMTAERTRMRGVTMALDAPGSLASVYTTNIANWQKFRDLKFNLVRLPFSIEYEGNTLSSMLPDMDTVVQHAANTGMYVMFMLDGAYGEANYGEFARVWPTIAARYKDQSHVFYEMNNEPHWLCDHFTAAEYDQIVNIYNLMRAAAPNTLIGLLTPASVSGSGGAQSVINSINELKARGIGFANNNLNFFAFHCYGLDYQDAHIQGVVNFVPCLMTETVSGGPNSHEIPENEVYKIGRLENYRISWATLQPRFGEVSNIHTPYSNDETSLTGRIIPDLTAAGVTWPQDVITAAQRALPAGRLFEARTSFGVGVARVQAPGAIAGRVFASAATLARGNLVGVAGNQGLPKSISLNPKSPGSISQTSLNGPAVWTTTITAANITAGVTWAIIAANGTQRGNATVIGQNNSNYTINVPFVATGDKLRVWETGNTAVNVDSDPVTVLALTRVLEINPMQPGTYTGPTTVVTTITTKGISNITYALVDSDYVWRNGSATVAVNPAGDTKVVNVNYNTNGQFFKVFDADDSNYKLDGLAVTINQPAPDPGVGTFIDFPNGTTGALTHVWGDRRQLSFPSPGIIRLTGIPGSDAWANACGVMMFPGGADAGFGYGKFEWHYRMSDYIGDLQGGAALTWPADDIWPGAEEDMGEINRDGVFYMAHHWRGQDGEDRAEYFTAPWHDPTQFFTARMDLRRDFLEYFVNDISIGSTTNNVTRAYGDGPNGMNRVPGIMNRSTNTWIEAKWFRHTPSGP